MSAPIGRLIAVEGVEGAGKSTQAAALARSLSAELTREPGGTALGERVRALLLDASAEPIGARTELLLMLAARSEHLLDRIEPVLGEGRHVVVDRFSGSTLAYQGHGRGLPLDSVRVLCDLAAGGRWPDLNVLVDVPVEVGAARRDRPLDRIEAEESAFHERVRRGFFAEAALDPEHWVVVDGTAVAEDVAAAVLETVRDRLGLEVKAAR